MSKGKPEKWGLFPDTSIPELFALQILGDTERVREIAGQIATNRLFAYADGPERLRPDIANWQSEHIQTFHDMVRYGLFDSIRSSHPDALEEWARICEAELLSRE